jgi:hypothetical protein
VSKKKTPVPTTATEIMVEEETRMELEKRIRLMMKLKSVIDEIDKAGMFFPWYKK